ncbi:MAG: hypothetical protein K2N56_09580 [Oscillospiraceae bacterium]|nr:hypothetical protein [Oscillospiraceae bacterium]
MNDSNDKVMGVLCYIPFVCLIPIILGGSPFVRYHSNQGLVLFIAELIMGAISTLCGLLLGIIPVIGGWIGGLIGGIFGLIALLYIIVGVVHVVNMETKPLPGIGAITLLK